MKSPDLAQDNIDQHIAAMFSQAEGKNLSGSPKPPQYTLPNIPLAEVVTELINDTDRDETDEEVLKLWIGFDAYAMHPAASRWLRGGWSKLGEALSDSEYANENMTRQLRALVLTEALFYQTGLPVRRKYSFTSATQKLTVKERNFMADRLGKEVAQIELLVDDDGVYQTAIAAAQGFKERLSNNLATVPETDAQFCGFVEKASYFEDVLRIGGHFPDTWTTMTSPQAQSWANSLHSETNKILCENPRFSDLLLDGRFPVVNTYTAWVIWEAAWSHATRVPELVSYFTHFPDPNFAKIIWETVLDSGVVKPRPYLDPGSYAASPEALGDFLRTIPLDQFSDPVQIRLIRKMLLFAGIAKTIDGDSPAMRLMVDRTQELIEGLSGGKFIDESQVLHDQVPGVLYINSSGEARARLQPANMNGGEFFDQLMSNGIRPIYLSKAEAEVISPKREPGEKSEIPIEVAMIVPSNDWEQVGILGRDLGKILTIMDQKLAAAGVDEEKALDTLVKYSTSGVSSQPKVLLPQLLSDKHPLTALKELGIVAVTCQKGQVEYLIDTKALGVSCDAALIQFFGRINKQDLTIDGTDEAFSVSALNLFLQASAMFIQGHFPDLALTREELSELRSFIKSYNRAANAQKRPLLRFDENPRDRDPGLPQTVAYIGQKPILLSINR